MTQATQTEAMLSRPPFGDRLLVLARTSSEKRPLFTIAIPHYKHRRYLEIVLQSLFEQEFADFEIVVSDDCSPDDSVDVIPDLLHRSGRPFRYYHQPQNLGYDGNVRFCLAAAQGRYVFLLGNDDALSGATVLTELERELRTLAWPQVAFTNYGDWATGAQTRRAHTTQRLGSGPAAAVKFFRSFSFVSGLIFEQALAQEHETDRWDRSVYYQIYLATRIIAAGGALAALAVDAVRKDVCIDGQTVPTYATKWAGAPRSFEPHQTGLESVIRVAVDGVAPYVEKRERSRAIRRIVAQIYGFTYPYWLLEYRHVANWGFAIGIARSLWPPKLIAEYDLVWLDRLILWLNYIIMTIAGLFTPLSLFARLKTTLADIVRQFLQKS